MPVLFFDTETTGLPDNKQPTNLDVQPHIVQMAALLCSDDGEIKAEMCLMVQPQGFTVPSKAADIHGITTHMAMQYGMSLRGVMTLFNRMLTRSQMVVAHNLKFDKFLIECSARRAGFDVGEFAFPEEYCTMERATNIVKLPPSERMKAVGMTGHKSPSLKEAYGHFYGRENQGAHNAMADVRACREIYLAIQQHQQEAA